MVRVEEEPDLCGGVGSCVRAKSPQRCWRAKVVDTNDRGRLVSSKRLKKMCRHSNTHKLNTFGEEK